jgi:hypothetical protein
MADVFISYSRKDTEFVHRLHESLAQGSRDIWVDWQDIPPTAEWLREIFSSIEAADNFLFVVSPESCASEMCRQEVAYAEANHKRMIPVVCRPVDPQALPPAVARIQWISFTSGSFEAAFRSLIEALDTDLDWVRSHTRLLVRAREWDVKGRDGSFLLRGMDLQDATQWLAQAVIREPTAAALQREYIRASQEWEAGEIQRLRELNEEKGRQARIAIARERVSYALGSLEENPELSLLLAMHAVAATRSHDRSVVPKAEEMVHRALLKSQVRLTLNSVAWAPTGQGVATGSTDGTAKIWEATTGREMLVLSGHRGAVSSVAWSPDGERVATRSADHTARLWEPAKGRELLTLPVAWEPVTSVAWSPDGKRLASAGEDRTVQVYAMDLELLMFLARSRVTSNLTLEECRKYLHVDEVPPIP